MKKEVNQKYTELLLLLSRDRVDTYLLMSNNNMILAYRKYRLNSELSAVSYEILSHLEVLLRNTIVLNWNAYLSHSIPQHLPSWPQDLTSLNLLKGRVSNMDLTHHKKDIDTATTKYTSYMEKKDSSTSVKPMNNGDLISNLNFGFWNNCFRHQFNIINRAKIYKMFPNSTKTNSSEKDVSEIRKKIYMAYQLRNRIAHHEPIINSVNLLKDFDAIMNLITFINSDYEKLFLRNKAAKFVKLYKKIP